jgi:hypothetical protein
MVPAPDTELTIATSISKGLAYEDEFGEQWEKDHREAHYLVQQVEEELM